MFEKCDSSNRHKGVNASFNILARFTAKSELVFVLTQESAFLRGFTLKPTDRA